MRNENAFSGNKPDTSPQEITSFQKMIAAAMIQTGQRFLNPPKFQPGDLIQPAAAFPEDADKPAICGVVLVVYPDMSVITEDPEDKDVLAYQVARIAQDTDELLFERVTMPAFQCAPYTGPRPDGA